MTNDLAVRGPETAAALTDDDFAQFDVEELAVFDVTTATALPNLGASEAKRFTCCSSSSSSSCCST